MELTDAEKEAIREVTKAVIKIYQYSPTNINVEVNSLVSVVITVCNHMAQETGVPMDFMVKTVIKAIENGYEQFEMGNYSSSIDEEIQNVPTSNRLN